MSSAAVFAAIDSSSDSTSVGFDSAWSSFALCCIHKEKNEVPLEWEKQLFTMEAKWSEAEQQAAAAALSMSSPNDAVFVSGPRTPRQCQSRKFPLSMVQSSPRSTSKQSTPRSTPKQSEPRSASKQASLAMAKVEEHEFSTASLSKSDVSADCMFLAALAKAKVEEDALSTASGSVVALGMSEPDQEPEAGHSARAPGNTASLSLATPQNVVRQARSRRFSQTRTKTTDANVPLSQHLLGA